MDTKKASRETKKIAFQYIPSEFVLNQIGLSSALSNEDDVRRLCVKQSLLDPVTKSASDLLLDDYLLSLYLHLKSLRESELSQLQSTLDL